MPKTTPKQDARTPWRRLAADRLARWSVTGGGLAVIASILGILVFIVIEVAPLAIGARVETGRDWDLAGVAPEAVVRTDEHREKIALLDRAGRFLVVDAADGSLVEDRPLAGPLERVGSVPGRQLLTGSTPDGRILVVPVEWETSFVGDERHIDAREPEPLFVDLETGGQPVRRYATGHGEDGSLTVVAQDTEGMLRLARRETEENLFTGEVVESWARHAQPAGRPLTALLLDGEQRNLFAGSETGELLWWQLDGGGLGEPQVVGQGRAPVTALSFLIGDRSLVVGREDGSVEIWFPVREEGNRFNLELIREFPRHAAPIRLLTPSMRNKAFAALDRDGRIGLYYSTSGRTLWEGDSPLPGATAMFYAPKGDSLLLFEQGRMAELRVHNPHPEISLRALFAKIWYEGYERPEYVWQSTGGTDDFESKLSLTPLIVGTIKGTIYSLLLAIPLGVLGGMYTSQFMHPGLRRYVKPTVEIMAALPSVVLGFLAGLWLAPRVEQIIPALALMLVVLPIAVVLAGLGWRALPLAIRGRFVTGSETFLYMVVCALAIWICLELNGAVESLVFGGDFQGWLLELTGLRYDQRNAVVVGLAMGFAVIPIIFSLAEDAFSNVPNSLVSGSLALGANRWQTVTRVVLPTASAGIFSAIMIGFGRAVGETMIVLMATGNTPVLDWNPFNGFRTLSANIAVEIPEAPFGGTLYRTLFLAALILFVFTFVINTAAELVRQRLRKRYAQL